MSTKYIFAFLGFVIMAPLGWWLLSPLFIDTVVDEKLEYETPSNTDTQVTLATGTFTGADAIHRGSGSARIIDVGTEKVLRLEDFEVTNGPDLFVLLSSSAKPHSHDELGEYIELGKLKGNIGDQNYTIPEGVAIDSYTSVVIYCKAFSVVFATAALE